MRVTAVAASSSAATSITSGIYNLIRCFGATPHKCVEFHKRLPRLQNDYNLIGATGVMLCRSVCRVNFLVCPYLCPPRLEPSARRADSGCPAAWVARAQGAELRDLSSAQPTSVGPHLAMVRLIA